MKVLSSCINFKEVKMSKDTKDALKGAGMILALLLMSGLMTHYVDGIY